MGSVSDAMLLAAEAGPHLPSVSDFLPPEILFEGTPFAINRIILIRIIATVVLLTVMVVTACRAKVVPGRWQAAVEWVLDFVRDNIIYQVMGRDPWAALHPDDHDHLPDGVRVQHLRRHPRYEHRGHRDRHHAAGFSRCGVFCSTGSPACGRRASGRSSRRSCFRPACPGRSTSSLRPIQLLELLVIRPLSLTIRLFANMIAGHLLLATCLAFAQFYIIESADKLAGVPVGGLWFIGGFVFTLFEMFVAALQAYVFAILATVYINQSYPEE